MTRVKKVKPMEGTIKSKHIAVSNDTYLRLKQLGDFDDTFDDVITSLLNIIKAFDRRVGLPIDISAKLRRAEQESISAMDSSSSLNTLENGERHSN